MPIGRRLPRPPSGAQLPARQREAMAMLERLSRIRGGRGTMQTPAGPFIAQPGVPIRIGMTPSGGIPAASGSTFTAVNVADCSIVLNSTYRATLQTWDTTFPGFNLSQQPAAGDTLTLYELLWGIWVCTWEECPTSGS